MPHRYANITVSGGVAVGSTTLLNNLQPYLIPKGFTFTSIGALHRSRLKQAHGENADSHTPLARQTGEHYNRDIEEHVRSILAREEKYVIDAWLAGFIARDLPRTLRVLLHISDEDTRYKRFMEREHVTYEEAQQSITTRERENFSFWQKLYGEFDFWNPTYFQLIIDTGTTSAEDTCTQVLTEFGHNVL